MSSFEVSVPPIQKIVFAPVFLTRPKPYGNSVRAFQGAAEELFRGMESRYDCIRLRIGENVEMDLKPDLVRDLLLRIETEQRSPEWELTIGSDEDYPLYYVATKLIEAGLIRGDNTPYLGRGQFVEIHELSYDGHQFLENIRDSNVWTATKISAQKIGSFALSVLSEIARGIITSKLQQIGIQGL